MKNIILNIIGMLCMGIGFIGIFVPILPTTPLIILSAVCFSIANKRLAIKLENSKLFGSYISNYRNKTGVARKVKVWSLIYLWVSLGISMIFIKNIVVIAVLAVIGTAVSIHILMLRNKK